MSTPTDPEFLIRTDANGPIAPRRPRSPQPYADARPVTAEDFRRHIAGLPTHARSYLDACDAAHESGKALAAFAADVERAASSKRTTYVVDQAALSYLAGRLRAASEQLVGYDTIAEAMRERIHRATTPTP